MEIDTANVLCPYCQNKCGDDEDFYGSEWEERNEDFECNNCGKKFSARRVVMVDYRSEKDCELNGEEHEAGEYHCKKCDVYNSLIEYKK